jgi:hypothetical protein
VRSVSVPHVSSYPGHMAVDAELLKAAREAEARCVHATRAADIARAEFRHAVRRLHLAGGSLREIADALGLSHQRIHQIVEEAGGGSGSRSFTIRGVGKPGGTLACSFCGKAQKQAGKLIAGPDARICDQCVATADQVIATGETAATPLSAVKSIGADLPAIKCSFCGKTREQVPGIAAAAHGTICSECLLLCNEIVAEELA